MADSYLDLLGEEEFETYVPPTSETQAYLDWESTAARDRFSDEYSLQRFPDQGPYGLGTLSLPEWFPPEYVEYANSVSANNSTVPRASTTPTEMVYETPEGENLLLEALEAIGGNPTSFIQDASTSTGSQLSKYDQVINDTSFLYDPSKVRTLSGESIADQEWFTAEKKEVLRKYFADVKTISADPMAYLQDKASISKSLVWDDVKKALAAGVDPDAIWAKLKPMSEKPHDSWASSQPLAKGGESLEFQTMTAEHSLAKFDEFTNKLAVLRATDPDIYQETYAYLPLQDKLRYLNDLQSKGSLTKEEYEGLYIQEVNALYDPEKTPNNYKFVEIGGKTYLDTSGPRDLDVKDDLYEFNFYPDTSDPVDSYNSFTSMAGTNRGKQTEDFDSSAWDFFDPIMNVVSAFAPSVALAYTAVKGLSGETLHTSDWLRAAPGMVEGINYSLDAMNLSDLAIPTTLGEAFPNIDLAEFGNINISVAGRRCRR